MKPPAALLKRDLHYTPTSLHGIQAKANKNGHSKRGLIPLSVTRWLFGELR